MDVPRRNCREAVQPSPLLPERETETSLTFVMLHSTPAPREVRLPTQVGEHAPALALNVL
jgi:hypothetical protein